jgi:hypothetical protein
MTITAKALSTFNCGAAVNRIISAARDTTFKTWTGWIGRGVAGLRDLAPYAAIEILLPGGSLMALALWFYRRHKRTKTRKGQRTTMYEGQRTKTRRGQRTTTCEVNAT